MKPSLLFSQTLSAVLASGLALALFTSQGCSLTSEGGHPASSSDLQTEVNAAPRVARAAVDEARKQLEKPTPAVPKAKDMLEIAASALPESDQQSRDLVAGVIADNGKLREAVARAEREKAESAAALDSARGEAATLREQLNAANRKPLYWVSSIVGGILLLSGGVIAAFGAQLGITAGPVKGGILAAFGAFSLGALFVVDRVLDSEQVSVALWILVAAVAIAVPYSLWRWIVQGRTLALSVAETDKLKAAVPPEAVEAFEASAGRAMDKAHKAVVNLARKVSV